MKQHSAIIQDRTKYDKVRRKSNSFGTGIDAVFGITKNDKSELQEIRFDKEKFTVEEAKKWLKQHDYKSLEFYTDASKEESMFGVLRYDLVALKGKAFKTDEGYVKAEAVVTRAGIFKYMDSNGSERLELRPPEEVFNPDSMESLKLKPMTNGHPPERLVNSQNAKEYQVGYTGENVKQDEHDLLTSLVITNIDAIDDVDLGKRELSCGYTCDLVEEPGVFNGLPFTHKQSNIKYNHVAICDMARAGHGAKLNFERNDAIQIQYSEGGQDMPKDIVADEKCKDCDAWEKKYNDKCKELDDMKKTNDEFMSKEKAKEEEEKSKKDSIDVLTAERDSLKSVVDSIPEKIAMAIKSRRDLEVNAAKVIPEQADKFDTMTEKEIRLAAITSKFADIKLDDKTDEYVNACFDMAVKLPRIATPSDINKMLSAGHQVANDDQPKETFGSEEARQGMIKNK
jgi:hypothetical protein